MSERPPQADSFGVMMKQMALVVMGLVALVLVLAVVGAIGDRYYAARDAAKTSALEHQEAFASGMTYEAYTAARREEEAREAAEDEALHSLEAERAAATVGSQPQAAASHDAQPAPDQSRPPLAPGQQVLARPDLTITAADVAAMKGKAAVIHTSLGDMTVQLYPDEAPAAVKNFIYLARNGFYNGLYFSRVNHGYYVSAGSPDGQRGGTAGYVVDVGVSSLYPALGVVAFVPAAIDGKVSSEFAIINGIIEGMEDQFYPFGRVIDRFTLTDKIADTDIVLEGYALDHVYITGVDIVDMASVKPAVDIWARPPAEKMLSLEKQAESK